MVKTKESVQKAEEQIYELRKTVSYDIRELTVEILVKKYQKGKGYNPDDEFQDSSEYYNVVFVPEYQRDFTWDNARKSKFIESVILGLPVPLIFVAEDKNGAWEIVDGSQRIRTLDAFLNNELELSKLENLDSLNGFCFSDLDKGRQGKILNIALRMIVLSEDTTEDVKRDMFDRINRGSDLLKPMEVRKGAFKGEFTDFIYDVCAKKQLFIKLAPIDKWLEKRQEHEELILRFFALSDNDNYNKFPPKMGISKFLDIYIQKKNEELKNSSNKGNILQKLENEFDNVLKFINNSSEYGFRRSHNPQTKRALFEAISVGTHLALKRNAKVLVSKEDFSKIINSLEFRPLWMTTTELHKPTKVKARIEFIMNELIKRK